IKLVSLGLYWHRINVLGKKSRKQLRTHRAFALVTRPCAAAHDEISSRRIAAAIKPGKVSGVQATAKKHAADTSLDITFCCFSQNDLEIYQTLLR
ncbi:MAG: hypothetical protein KGL57_10210, partial [Burkholderiales bacterium]|nr:hypothetical protein [Burkholderiales bacterium]